MDVILGLPHEDSHDYHETLQALLHMRPENITYLGYSVYMSKRGADNIGHSAHFWGALFGLVFTFLLMRKDIITFYTDLLSR